MADNKGYEYEERDYTVNPDDPRLQQSSEKYDKLDTDLEQTYTGMIGGAENIYQPQIDALEEWKNTQTQLQNERTDLTIQQIEQQKAQARQDYQKEQSGAYVDWRKQSNQYGTEAEKMASSGLMGTGFSESSQVGMYNTYQNRVAQARESFDRVIMNYNNSINEAKLQNNSALAEIALNTLQQQTELIVQGTIYKNSLITELADKKLQLQQMRDNDWYKILDQINTENAMAQSDRQFAAKLDFESTQAELDRAFQREVEDAKFRFQEAQAQLERDHDFRLLKATTEAEKERAKAEHELAMKKLEQQHKNDLAILEKQYEISKRSSGTSFSGKGSGGGSGGSTKTSKKTGIANTNKNKMKKSATSTNTGTKKATVDTKSVLALGQGPISGKNLASQVASGKVSASVKNGKYVFGYTPQLPTSKLRK